MTKLLRSLTAAAILSLAGTLAAQTPAPTPPSPPTEQTAPPVTEQTAPPQQTPPPATAPEQTVPPPPPPVEQTPPSVLSDTAAGAYDRRDPLPDVNIYIPEGEASIRLRKLIRNALFETQLRYEFVNGDISTFLRYKYYARNYTYRIGVFDTIEFPDLASDDNTEEFERVRGGLLLIGVPRDVNNRYYFLLQNDSLSFGDTNNPDNRKNNIYTKVGYQFGTQFDERMNAIVGESRGRITPVLTAYRDIGPQRTGLAAALTLSGDVLGADYRYAKLEGEGLRRFDLTATSFVFSRLHAGAFFGHGDIVPVPRDRDGDGDIDPVPLWEYYTIPRYEFFRIGGREALKSIDGSDESIGTHEVHLTNEVFVPIFRNRNYRTGPLYWTTAYGIGYVGVGSLAFEWKDIIDSERLAYDAGLGTEIALSFRDDLDIFLSIIVARTLKAPDDIGGTEVRFSVRTVR